MGAFLSVAKGSQEEPWLLEVHYNSPTREGKEGERPTVLVGKGELLMENKSQKTLVFG